MTAEEELAAALVAAVGGPGNIVAVEHCVTRLRFVLRDPGLARPGEAEAQAGVLRVVQRAGQFHVIIGNEVADTYRAIEQMPGLVTTENRSLVDEIPAGDADAPPAEDGGAAARPSLVARALDLLIGTFQPLLWVLVGSSLISTVLAVVVQLGWTTTDSPVYAVWAAAGSAAFYFLPVLVGSSASRKLGANPFVGAAIGAALLEAHYVGIGASGTSVDFLGIPLRVADYGQSVFPALLAAVGLAWLEKRLRRMVPKDLRLIVVPTLCLAILVPVTLVLFGPVGTVVSEALSDAVRWVWELSPALAGAIMGGLWQVFVMFGVHWGFVPVIVNDLNVQGHSLLTGPLVSAVLAQGGATLAVLLRTRNRELRSLAGAASISAFVAGVTEPAIYGVTLRLRRPFVCACIGGAVGGAIAAIGRSAANGFVFPSLISLPSYLGVGSFGMQVTGVAVAVGLAFGLTWFVGFEDPVPAGAPTTSAGAGTTPAGPGPDRAVPEVARPDALPLPVAPPAVAGPEEIPDSTSPGWSVGAPISGTIVPLASVSDPVFARGLLGPGVAVHPDDGWVRSPVTGTVTSVARGRHAIGVTSRDGVDVMVHVGLDTVGLAGAGFDLAVASGDQVEAGQVLLHVDLGLLAAQGCELTSPVVVTNAAQFAEVVPTSAAHVSAGEPILRIRTSHEEPAQHDHL